MWVAVNRDGKARLFEMPPRRFHDGPMLPAELVGFDDAVSVGDGKDEYSFWAVQKYYKSNEIEGSEYGYIIMTEDIEDGRPIWFEYVPDCIKDMTWEDEPVEVEISIKRKEN
jgi:hypothetical protein